MDMGVNKTQKIQPPRPLSAHGDLSKNWCIWKKDLIEFLKKKDSSGSYKETWGTYLLMYIGPIGHEALKKLAKDTMLGKENFDEMLKNLDLYFIFQDKTMKQNENIEEYIANLTETAMKSNHCNVQGIVKQKVINDIMQQIFDADFQKYLQSLNLSEIVSEWVSLQKSIRETNKKSNDKQNVKKPLIDNNITECIRCGTLHARNKCPAHGKQCNKCKKLNHFAQKCKTNITFIENCTKCGFGHKQTECPAFGYTCSKCGKSNHYTWKCRVPLVANCSRCGTDHVMSLCPAQGKICSLCNKPNHLEEKCISNKNM